MAVYITTCGEKLGTSNCGDFYAVSGGSLVIQCEKCEKKEK